MLTEPERQAVLRIGTASWNIPKQHAARFAGANLPATGAHLERYASQLNAVEINTSFYRPHRRQTFARWAASAPADFQFAVKAPKAITHELRLRNAAAKIAPFVEEISGLGAKLGCVLIQLPPSLRFDREIAATFFESFRRHFEGTLVCEPRHATWFDDAAHCLFHDHNVSRVAADPAVHPNAFTPAGSLRTKYFRLHGSPKTYYSPYSAAYLSDLARHLQTIRSSTETIWCIFDNTAEGHATADALELKSKLTANA